MKDVLVVPRRTDQVLYTMGGSWSSKCSLPLICKLMYVASLPCLPFLQNVQDKSLMGSAVFLEDFYKTINEVHDNELLHAGYHKTYEKVCKSSYLSEDL